MTNGRLSLYSSRLAAACDAAEARELRAMAEVGSRIALTETGVEAPVIAEALRSVLAGRFGPGSVRDAVAAFVDDLDAEAFDLADAIDEGEAVRDEYLRVFQQARAAASLLWTLHEDPQLAAHNALYEAIAALGEDPAQLEDTVLAARGV